MHTAGLVTLLSDDLEVVVAPLLGGRVLSLTDVRRERQWMWHNENVPLVPPDPGAAYDDVWVGGFEELFPNDAPGEVAGLSLPDHGEVWSRPWEVTARDDATVRLEVTAPVSGCVVRKALRVDGPRLDVEYEITAGSVALPYLFKLHPALAINADCTIDLPGGTVEQVVPGFGTMLGTVDHVAWPGPPDAALDRCRPADSGDNEFVYVSGMPAGQCGVTDRAAGASIRFDYDPESFPYCWLFLTYGGWRGHSVAVLEPCTTYPKDLAVAASSGTTPRIVPEATHRYSVAVEIGSA